MIVHKIFLRCSYHGWSWEMISQSTSPNQGNFQSSATSTVFVPQNFHAHQWKALLIYLQYMLAWLWRQRNRVTVSLWTSRKVNRVGHILEALVECRLEASEY